jgi:hypothetical protein
MKQAMHIFQSTKTFWYFLSFTMKLLTWQNKTRRQSYKTFLSLKKLLNFSEVTYFQFIK